MATERTIIHTEEVHVAKAPYNQAVVAGNLIYTAGCLGITKEGQLAPGGITAEAEQALKNLEAILRAANSNFNQVVKVTVLLADIADWPTVNEVYKKFFTDPTKYPARTAYQAGALPLGAKIEIELVAIRGDVKEGQQAGKL